MPTITVDIRAVGAEGVSRSMEQAARSIGQNLPRAAATAERAVAGLSGRMEVLASVTARVRSQAVGAFAGFIGAGALVGATKSIIDASNAMIGFRNSLEAAAGGSAGASKSLAFVRFESERLGLSLETSARQFASISNAARGTALEGEGVQKVFTSIAQAARVMNLSNDSVQGAFVAISQMMGKGAIMAEELRGQLAERIPGAVKIMADGLGVGIAELNKMMETGLRGEAAYEAVRKFAEELDRVYSIQAMNAANSPAAEFARLGNAIFDLQNAIGSSGLMDSLAGISRGFTEGIRGIIEGGWIDKITEGMKALAVAIGVAFGGKTLEFIGSFVTKMGDATKAIGLQRAETIKLAQARVADAMANEAALKATAAKASQAVVDAQANAVKKTSIRTIEAYELALKREAAALRNVTLATLETTMAGRALSAGIAQQTGMMASLSAAAAKAGAAIKTAFAAIGGWFTVAIAGIYGAYEAYKYLTTGTEESAKATEKATTLIDQNARANERLIVQLRGVSEENANTIVAFDELNASIAASTTRLGELQAKYDGMSTLETVGRFAKFIDPRGYVEDVAAWVTGGDSTLKDTTEIIKNREAVEEATKARQDLANSIIHTAQVQEAFAASQGKSSDALENALKILELNGVSADILSAALENSSERMADAARNALNLAVASDKEAIAQGKASSSVIAAVDTYAAAGVELGVLIDMLEKAGAAQAYFNALFGRGAKGDSGVTTVFGSKGLADIEAKIRALEVQADKTGKLAAEEIRLDAAMAAALATRQEDKDAIIARGEVLAQMTIASMANAAAQKEATKAEKELQSIVEKMPGMLDAARQKIEELEEADGRYSSALRELNKTENQANQIRENAARLLEARKISADEYAEAEAIANRLVDEGVAKHTRLTAAIEAEAATINGLIPKLREMKNVFGASDRTRYIAAAVADATAKYEAADESFRKAAGGLDAYTAAAAAAAGKTYDLIEADAIIQKAFDAWDDLKSPFAKISEDIAKVQALLDAGGLGEEQAAAAERAIKIMRGQLELVSQETLADSIGKFRDMASAMEGIADEGSTIQKRLRQVSAVMGVIQAISQAQIAITNMQAAAEAAKTVQTVAGASASGAKAIADAGQGDPYTGIARAAAMAAIIVPVIASIGGALAAFGGGGGGPAGNSAEVRQATQGTGTVLGDAAAKSESIVNAVEITANATQQLVGINRGMLNALNNMQAALSGASTLLARGAGGAEFGGLSSGFSLPGISSIPVFGGLLSSALANIFGGKESLRDTGIRIVGGTLSQMLDDIMVQAYQTIHRSGGWFRSSRDYDRMADVGDDVSRQFQLVLASMADAVGAAAQALGLNMDEINAAIASYRIEEIRISTMNLSAEEAQKELEAVFSKIFDGLAGAVVPWIAEFQQVGEGLAETLIRVATGVQVTQEAMIQLGFALDETDPQKFAQISEGLMSLMGGIDGFIEGMSTFVNAFATDEHKFNVAQDAITRAFEQFGLAIPDTRDGMWELMQSLDATTESGREQIAMLLQLAGAADSYYQMLEKREAEYKRFIDQFRPDLTPATGADAASVSDAIRQSQVWAQYMVDQANQLAIAAGMAGAAEEDLALIHQRAADAVAAAVARLRATYDSFIDQFRPDATLPTGADAASVDEAIAQSQQWAQAMIYQANVLAVAAGLAGAAEEDLALIHARAAEYVAQATERIAAAAVSYNEQVQGIADQLAELRGATPYMKEMARIDRQYRDQVATLNAHARAAGRAGASERDLAMAIEVATLARAKALAQLEQEAAALAASLRMSALDAQIEALREQESAATSAISGFSGAMSDAGKAAAEAMGLLLGSYSPLRAVDKLPLALEALRRGDTDADTVLQIARDVYGSGAAYNRVFDQVQEIVRSQRAQDEGTGYTGATGTSAQMQALLDQRAEIQAAQEEAARFGQSSQLAAMIAELSAARGEDYATVAERLNYSLEQLAADLRLDGLDSLNEYLDTIASEQASIAMLFELPTAGDLAIIEAIEAIPEPPAAVITPVVTPVPVGGVQDTVAAERDAQVAADTREMLVMLRALVDRGIAAGEDTAATSERIADGVERLAEALDGGSAAVAAGQRRGG